MTETATTSLEERILFNDPLICMSREDGQVTNFYGKIKSISPKPHSFELFALDREPVDHCHNMVIQEKFEANGR